MINSAGVVSPVGLQEEPIACPQCGSTSRVGRGLCLKCLLYRGLGEETYDNETLENVLDTVDVRDADWRLGNYQVLEEIGRGGMGIIYRVRQRHSRRIVALKRILAHHADSRDTLVRFRREAEAAASLDHPNILPIYEVSEGEDGLPFFSMKFAAGGSLLESQAALQSETREAVALMAKVSRAVEYAHSRGILHRDLKPGNILLDGRGEPMVSDFGLAKWLDASSDLTRTLTVFGTPGYIAPEQAHGPASSLKPTADIYSLGAILFDLIAGRPPFLGEHAFSVIQQAAEKPAPKLRSINSKVDRDLETICARCLEREPGARYYSAGHLATDLERWLEGRPIVARPVSPVVRIWRWARRNPKLAASVAGCALGGLTILAFVTLTLISDGRLFQSKLGVSEKSIAILPFQNLSDEKQDAFFANGVQDEILNDLARVADLKVISRTSVMQYHSDSSRNLREIAKALGVAHVVEGSVQRIGDRVRVSAQLIDARTDTHIWAERYDRQLADVFAIESELAEQIVSRLKATLSPQEKGAIEERPTQNLAAYDLYLQAKTLIDGIGFTVTGKEDLLEATRLLESAVKTDPEFFLGYYQLARAHGIFYFQGLEHTPNRLALAEKAVAKMQRLRPNAGETHLALAQNLYWGSRDYARARQELAIARPLLPNEPLALVLAAYIDRREGRWEESTRELEQALQLDPRNTFVLQVVSYNYEYLRAFEKMATTSDRIIAIDANNVVARVHRAWIDLLWHADPQPLRSAIESVLRTEPTAAASISGYWMYCALWQRDASELKRAVAVLPNDGCRDDAIPFPHAWCEGVAARSENNENAARAAFTRARSQVAELVQQQANYAEAICALGVIDAALGKKDEAIKEGRRAVNLVPPTKDAMGGAKLLEYLIFIHGWNGDKDSAIQELTKLAQMPSDLSYGELRLHPFLDPLRGDPRFEKIVASLAPDAKKP